MPLKGCRKLGRREHQAPRRDSLSQPVIARDEDCAERGIHQRDDVFVTGGQRRFTRRQRGVWHFGRFAKPGVQHQGLEYGIHIGFTQPVPLGDSRPQENASVLDEQRL